MKQIKFLKDLAKYFINNSITDFKVPKRILEIFNNNLTDKEKDKCRFYIYKCLTSIHRQLTIDEFKKLPPQF